MPSGAGRARGAGCRSASSGMEDRHHDRALAHQRGVPVDAWRAPRRPSPTRSMTGARMHTAWNGGPSRPRRSATSTRLEGVDLAAEAVAARRRCRSPPGSAGRPGRRRISRRQQDGAGARAEHRPARRARTPAAARAARSARRASTSWSTPRRARRDGRRPRGARDGGPARPARPSDSSTCWCSANAPCRARTPTGVAVRSPAAVGELDVQVVHADAGHRAHRGHG